MRTVAPHGPALDRDHELSHIDQAESYIAGICFKTGPPRAIGAELEFTVHAADHPAHPVDGARLARALGQHAPPALDATSPHRPLRHGGAVTVAPGGQVELSSRPQPSPRDLHAAVNADLDQLHHLLGRAGLELGDAGIDPHRAPRRLLSSPRYRAMASSFARRGGDGRTMMCSTAGLKPCLDAGPASGLAARWAAVHEIGPTFVAAFANSPHFAGRATGWASTRMRTWHGMDPARVSAISTTGDPALAWARYALRAPLLCVRRPTGHWTAPPGITFADWICGALPGRPTYDDLDHHLGTLFPPVRPRGYLEIRYLDTQPGRDWFAPVALLQVLLADPPTVDAARDHAAPAAGRWVEAARYGLTDPVIATTAPALFDLALGALARSDLPAALVAEVADTVERRFRRSIPHTASWPRRCH